MGGETCAINPPRSNCATALSEMKRFHWSYLNIDYNQDVINGFVREGCFVTIQNGLGYRFELTNGTYPVASGIFDSVRESRFVKKKYMF